jgi:two-component system, response regulator RegA
MTAQPDPALLLLVEDDRALRTVLERALAARGFLVDAVDSKAAALAAVAARQPRFVVCDLRLPDGSGLDLLEELSQQAPAARAVVLTGWGSIPAALRAFRAGAVDFLTKPASADQIVAALLAEASATPPPELAVPTLDRVEWEHIQRVLSECGGNVSRAARLLGLDRRSLQRKLAKRPSGR